MIKIVPAHEFVIDPKTMKKINKDGIFITNISTYWKQRIIDGDVKITISKPESKGKSK